LESVPSTVYDLSNDIVLRQGKVIIEWGSNGRKKSKWKNS
jgi:hypothetical protein